MRVMVSCALRTAPSLRSTLRALGRRGPVTTRLQTAFFDVVNGNVPDTHGWLTYVYGDANKWHAIFDANRDKIKNPDLIQPGQVLTLPPNA